MDLVVTEDFIKGQLIQIKSMSRARKMAQGIKGPAASPDYLGWISATW